MKNITTLSITAIFILFIFNSYKTDPLEKGLVAYYSFDNCDAKDDTGNESDGIIYGRPNCVCGVKQDALYFDGNRDYIEFEGLVNNYFTTSDLTISFYFKPDKYSPFLQSMLSKRAVCDENNMMDISLNSSLQILDTDLYEKPEKFFRDLSPDLKETVWMHFALVREGTRAFSYINGQLRQSSFRCSGVDISNDALLSFANSPCVQGGRSVRFKGVLDELRIYDHAFTEEEIFELYKHAPIEMAEIDCVTFHEKNFQETNQTEYICAAKE